MSHTTFETYTKKMFASSGNLNPKGLRGAGGGRRGGREVDKNDSKVYVEKQILYNSQGK